MGVEFLYAGWLKSRQAQLSKQRSLCFIQEKTVISRGREDCTSFRAIMLVAWAVLCQAIFSSNSF